MMPLPTGSKFDVTTVNGNPLLLHNDSGSLPTTEHFTHEIVLLLEERQFVDVIDAQNMRPIESCLERIPPSYRTHFGAAERSFWLSVRFFEKVYARFIWEASDSRCCAPICKLW